MENTYAFFIKKELYLIIFNKVENEDREKLIQDTYDEGITKFVCAGYNFLAFARFLMEIHK